MVRSLTETRISLILVDDHPVYLAGLQQIFRKRTDFEVVGDADLARDHGFSSWVCVYPGRNLDLSVGYSRSVQYDFNSVFFGLGWSLGGF